MLNTDGNLALELPDLNLELETKIRSLKFKKWLRTSEVALYLDKTCEAIRKHYQRGTLSGKKFGKDIYFDRELIDQLIENSRNRGFGIQIPQPRGRRRWELKK